MPKTAILSLRFIAILPKVYVKKLGEQNRKQTRNGKKGKHGFVNWQKQDKNGRLILPIDKKEKGKNRDPKSDFEVTICYFKISTPAILRVILKFQIGTSKFPLIERSSELENCAFSL